MSRSRIAFRLLTFLTVLSGLVLGFKTEGLIAYVLPSEQVLQFMITNFSKLDTLVIKHYVERGTLEGTENFEEILTMKSPDLLHTEISDPFLHQKRIVDRRYRTLFLSGTPGRTAAFLREAGVDTDKVSYTRVDGAVAYLIGDRGAQSPKLAVDKARFLPLLFVYPSSPADLSEFVTVTFRDYRRVEQGWYPFQIICSSGKGWSERYEIRSIQANIPVHPSFFLKPERQSSFPERPGRNEDNDSLAKMFERESGR